MFAVTAYEFLHVDQLIPFMEASLRVFDRYGEREKRHKARLKFLIKKLGIEHFLALVETERKAIPTQSYPIEISSEWNTTIPENFEAEITEVEDKKKYSQWLKTNTFEQKQKGYFGVYLKILLGDLSSEKARYLAKIVQKYAADDIRLTINQNILLRYVRKEHLPELFTILNGFGFAEAGYNSIADITACPGTDTCNLAVTNSTGLTKVLENMLHAEYNNLIEEEHIKIKISGCMNACGQHMIGNIGFHGSSIKKNDHVIPAMQVVLGGGVDPSGQSYIADKIIKLPTKRIPQGVRVLLDHFEEHKIEGEYFNHFYARLGGRKYFYNLLKPLAEVSSIDQADLMDWGEDHLYNQAIGVGECAGVILDVIGTIVNDAKEKLEKGFQSLDEKDYAASIYYAYSAFVVGAKALLLSHDIKCNTHNRIITDFQEQIQNENKISLPYRFSDMVLSINSNEPSKHFAEIYVSEAEDFLATIIEKRNQHIVKSDSEKEVITSYYNA